MRISVVKFNAFVTDFQSLHGTYLAFDEVSIREFIQVFAASAEAHNLQVITSTRIDYGLTFSPRYSIAAPTPPLPWGRLPCPESPALSIILRSAGIRAVVWATFSWLHVPVFDRKGQILHDGGVVAAPGMYLLGMQFMRRRKSAVIDGAGDDAGDLGDQLLKYLNRGSASTEPSHQGAR